jgi:DNA-binding CsgD family transcriptional regulator
MADELLPNSDDSGRLARATLRTLTPRELQVLKLVASSKRNREIAVELGISQGTAKRHVEDILEKLAVRSRHQAAELLDRAKLGGKV